MKVDTSGELTKELERAKRRISEAMAALLSATTRMPSGRNLPSFLSCEAREEQGKLYRYRINLEVALAEAVRWANLLADQARDLATLAPETWGEPGLFNMCETTATDDSQDAAERGLPDSTAAAT